MKKTNQSKLAVAIIMLGVGTSAFAQQQNNHFALNNLFPVTANENVCLKNAPEIFNFTYPKPNSLFVDNYPKPDFSVMEEWYEIVKYEYDFRGMNNIPLFLVVVKKKVANAPVYFNVGWFDADGIRVGIDSTLIPVQGTIEGVPVGEPFRLRAYAPDKKDMQKVKSIVVKEKL
jgi:hypothetical protein